MTDEREQPQTDAESELEEEPQEDATTEQPEEEAEPSGERKLKGENKRLRHDRNQAVAEAERWKGVAVASLQREAEAAIGADTKVRNPAGLLARLGTIEEFLTEDGTLRRDELLKAANDLLRDVGAAPRRDHDQGRGRFDGHDEDEDTIDNWMRRGKRGHG